MSFVYHPDTPDPANGQNVIGDIWLRVAGDGSPIAFRGTYALPNGDLYQEIVQTPETTTVLLTPSHPALAVRGNAAPPASCAIRVPSSPTAMEAVAPPFADEATLARFGFARSGPSSTQLPSTPALAGITPTQVLAAASGAQVWARAESANGLTTVTRLETTAEGRVVATQEQSADSRGGRSETRTVYGALQVYTAQDVPPSVFSHSQQAREACRG